MGSLKLYERIVEASDIDAYWKCFDAATPRDTDPETSYEKWYGPLEAMIATVLEKAGIPKATIDFFDDWCPNNTRHVTIERAYANATLLSAIHDLIQGDYQRWRIEVTIVGVIKNDDELGKISIWSDWVLCWGIGKSLMSPTSPQK